MSPETVLKQILTRLNNLELKIDLLTQAISDLEAKPETKEKVRKVQDGTDKGKRRGNTDKKSG